MPYHVHIVEYFLSPGHHHYALFVEMNDGGSGCIFHVKGDISEGMEYEIKSETRPHLQENFSKIVIIGTVSFDMFPLFMEVCEGTPPPRKQLDDQGNKIDADEPLYRCVEWLDDVIKVSKDLGIINMIA
jgi:hypothetical protein